MITKPDKNKARLKRHLRVRKKIQGTAARPRLNVFRSGKHMYAQIIDDVAGVNNRFRVYRRQRIERRHQKWCIC